MPFFFFVVVEYTMERKQFELDLEIQNFLSSYSAALPLSILMQLGSLLFNPDQCFSALTSHFPYLLK